MAADVELNQKVYRNVSSVDLPRSGGGTARFREAEEVMEIPTAELAVVSNGDYNVRDYASVKVAVPTEGSESLPLQSKSVEPDTSQKVITADSGYGGLSSVTVGAIQVQEKRVTPSSVEQIITPDAGKYMSRVTVAAVGATAGEPVLSGITVSPESVTIPRNATDVRRYLTALTASYTLSGYTGSLTRDLTEFLASAIVTGDLPEAGATADITVSFSGKSTTVRVTRDQSTIAVTGVSLSLSSMVLSDGESGILTATVEPAAAANQEVSWESSAPSVAKVEKTDYLLAKVTALKTGSATITVRTTDGGFTATCEVTVQGGSAAVTCSEGTGTISPKTTMDATLNVTQTQALTTEPNRITIVMNSVCTPAVVNVIHDCILTKNSSGQWGGKIRTYNSRNDENQWRNFVDGGYAAVTISDGKVTSITVPKTYMSESLPNFNARFTPDEEGVSPTYHVTVETVESV